MRSPAASFSKILAFANSWGRRGRPSAPIEGRRTPKPTLPLRSRPPEPRLSKSRILRNRSSQAEHRPPTHGLRAGFPLTINRNGGAGVSPAPWLQTSALRPGLTSCITDGNISLGGDYMANSTKYGDPVVALRIPRSMISAARVAARNHDTTLSGLMRDLLAQQLVQDGIDWTTPSEPIPGQQTIDELPSA